MTVEEGDLLYALVRMTKPKLAIETGTGHAIATRRIGEALRDNGEGFLLSCDTELEYVRDARMATKGLPVDIRCTTGLATLGSFDTRQAEFIFIDAGDAGNRLSEVRLIVNKKLLAPNGTLAIHDALNPKYRSVIDFFRGGPSHLEWLWPGLIFESLAGIAVLRNDAT